MPKKKDWWFPLDTGDWMKDPQLSTCAPATRGIWIDLICAMWTLDKTGLLTGNLTELSRLARCSVAEMEAAVSELESKSVADVERGESATGGAFVTLKCRRMARDDEQRKLKNERQMRHRRKKSGASVDGDESDITITITITREIDGPIVDLPENLNTAQFRLAWARWVEHRCEIRKSMTPRAATMLLAKLAKWGEPRAVDALNHSMGNGWTGVFEDTKGRVAEKQGVIR